ncbi:MAG: hypothetical protein WCX32_03750 [Clostridia bacterium]|jgi:hypothetical protein|nr:hypothetical protein [Clostridia bacterium]
MKKYFSLIFIILFLFISLLGGCIREVSAPMTFTTTYPENFRIIVRVNTDTDFSEHIFAVSNGVYYYKYQEYTENFENIDSTTYQYVGIKSGTDFITYDYSDSNGWYIYNYPVFAGCWEYLNTYCSIYPNFVFTESQKQPDSTVNGTLCYTFNVNGIIYNISQDQYQIEWAFYTEPNHSYVLKYEVQSFTTTNCFSGVPTYNLPSA